MRKTGSALGGSQASPVIRTATTSVSRWRTVYSVSKTMGSKSGSELERERIRFSQRLCLKPCSIIICSAQTPVLRPNRERKHTLSRRDRDRKISNKREREREFHLAHSGAKRSCASTKAASGIYQRDEDRSDSPLLGHSQKRPHPL